VRIERTVTTVSWIPSEAVTGLNKAIFASGFTHYDDPPPDVLGDLEQAGSDDTFRFANRLHGWIDVQDGKVVEAGYVDGSVMGATTVRIGKKDLARFEAVAYEELRAEPEISETSARFVQTFGGRPALAAPRRVNHPPFVQIEGPTVWSTLALTLHTDGRSEWELVGASSFPRHWVYDEGKLAAKAGLTNFKEWWRHSFGKHTPWGYQDSPALVTAAESAFERQLSLQIMRGGEKPKVRKLKEGQVLVEQGQIGRELYLLLDGVISVEVDGESLGDLGPGAIVGERAILEGGRRTATLKAVTKARVAVADIDQIDTDALARVSEGHRREETRES